MEWNPIDVAASAVVLFVVGIVLWPPADVLWEWWGVLPESMRGDLVLLAMLFVSSGAAGAGLSRLVGVGLAELAVGGVIAYAVGMGLIEIAIAPDSPAHLLLYGVILVGAFLGAVGGNAIGADPGDAAENRTDSA